MSEPAACIQDEEGMLWQEFRAGMFASVPSLAEFDFMAKRIRKPGDVADSGNDLRDFIRSHPSQGFRPHVYYNSAGKQTEVYWEDERAVSREMDGFRVMVGMQTGRVVGVVIYDRPAPG